MNDTHEVISAFLDDEPFDSRQLAEALSEQAGRDLLIDLIALRHLAQTDAKEPLPSSTRTLSRSPLRDLVAAAAVVVALVGGYVVGQRRPEAPPSAPPAATRVVQAPAAWQDVTVGRTQ